MRINEENLIFIISQPRAGSTLLQNVLSNHQSIHSLSEPWILLPFLYDNFSFNLKIKNRKVEYTSYWASTAFNNFLNSIPSKHHYLEALREFFLNMYGGAMYCTDKSFFLDKTPQYYFIINEINTLFPKSKKIILIRNPLAVLASILDTWVEKENLLYLKTYKHDLLTAPLLIAEAIDKISNNLAFVHYENYIVSPQLEIDKICDFIGVDFHESMLNLTETKSYIFGDPKIKSTEKIITDNNKQWIKKVNSPQKVRLMVDYLQMLGSNVYEKLGYDYQEAFDTLMKLNQRFKPKKYNTLSLNTIIGDKLNPIRKIIQMNKSLKRRVYPN